MTGATSTWTLQQWPVAERPEAARHLISRTHLPWRLDVDREADPRAAVVITERRLDDLRLVDCTTGPCSGRRERAEIGRTDGEFVGVLMVLDGREHIEQDDRRIVLDRGQAMLWTSTRPVRFAVPARLAKRTLLVPRARLTALVPLRDDRIMRLPPGPAGRLLVDLLGSVSAAGDDLGGDLGGGAASGAATAALELLAAALSDDRCTEAGRSGWERVRDHIEEHLADPELRPHRIAAAQSISLRGLYLLFERRGETVSGYVRRRRLVHARAELARLGTSTTVATVAHRWGFADQAGFSRAFRRQFGHPPDDVRRGRVHTRGRRDG